MDRYSARINLYGNTKRERDLNLSKQSLEKNAPTSLSCKDILLNGQSYRLVINKGTQPYYKEFETLPGQNINIGDYVDFANQKWLVTTADSDNEVYTVGKLKQCNWLLKWQNSDGNIVERWAVVSSASKYNDGETGNNIITLGSDQLSVQIPIDNESLHIKRKTKFFIDNNSENPTVYELTGTGNVVDTYNGHGVTSWIVKECAYSPTANDLLYGVCDYFTPTTPSVPSDTWNMLMICNNYNLRIGGSPKTITGQLVDSNGNNLECTYVWTITGDYASSMITTITDNVLVIAAPDSIEENTTITISVASKYTGQVAEQVFSVELGV